jgi:hypothetical protein
MAKRLSRRPTTNRRTKTVARPAPSAELPEDAAIRLIGVDCATLAQNTGFAVGSLDPANPARVRIHAARCCAASDELAALSVDAIGDRPALLGLDAPLGWPAPLADTLSWHQAGAPLGSPILPDDRMFSRVTDLDIRARFGRRPLEVGADRIARTARAALRLLADVEVRRNKPVPLGWAPGPPDGVHALEVYPAATLAAYRIASKGYRQEPARRRAVLRALAPQLTLPRGLDRLLVANPHALDAVLCVLAAADYLRGLAVPPPLEHAGVSRREGWIWVRAASP